jgi:DNA-binding NarL/FixJ family response regulator
VTYVVLHLAAIEVMHGNYADAARLAEESLSRYRCTGDDAERGLALLVLLTAAGELGEVATAAALFEQLLVLSAHVQHAGLMALCGAGMAWISRDRGDPERLACLVGAVETRHHRADQVGRVLRRMYAAAAGETLRARMGNEAFDAALAEGRSLTLEQMSVLLEHTREEAFRLAASNECQAKRTQPSVLSPREHEVLRLVAQGLSNKRIAREIIVSDSTVASHLTSIFSKLGVDTRAHAVAVGVQRGLVVLGQGPR